MKTSERLARLTEIPAFKPVLKLFGLPFLWFELRGFRTLLINVYEGWDYRPEAGSVIRRGVTHRYLMKLDLRYWYDRWTYRLGRYYETHTELLFRELLRPGDVVIDIGANSGMLTLLAASSVGTEGRVVAFEPNPQVFARLHEQIELNNLQRVVTTYDRAVGDRPATLTLRVPVGHIGGATLAGDAGAFDGPTTEVAVQVVNGDEAIAPTLAALPRAPLFLKIDVEGFELHVLRGLEKTIASRAPAVFTEVLPENLARAGETPASLTRWMTDRGYEGYWVSCKKGLTRAGHRLVLIRMTDPDHRQSDDALWLPRGSVHGERLARYMA
ncbi:MAG: FkbM family methyltransferase [Phycisphaerales bacterium]|nr:FkbM family methyltransferase [Phycisphaerales bacterium]